MSEPTKCYAVSSGSYSDYKVHAIYRRREDAEARVRANNEAPPYLLDGVPASVQAVEQAQEAAGCGWGYTESACIDAERRRRYRAVNAWRSEHVELNPARDYEELHVEEFDYYEGEPLPAGLEAT